MQSVATVQAAAHWLRSRGIGSLCTDSRQLREGDGLLAWPGAAHDARAHVQRALALGAIACLVEASGAEAFHFDDHRIACYRDLKRASGRVADCYFDHPSHALAVLAVTGTNGKTSTVWWLAQALSGLPGPTPWLCGMVGTLGTGFVPVDAASASAARLSGTGLTTPDGVHLQAALRDMCTAGARACAIEASSIGIVEQRLAGTRIHTAIFTNFTQDHLDYHGSMEAYWRAKESLFDWPDLHAAVVNTDDPAGARLARSLQNRPLDLWTVSCTAAARLRACDVEARAGGLRFVLQEAFERHRVTTSLIGHYNVSNLLGVVAAMRTVGIPLADAAAACNRLTPVPGRLQSTMLRGKPLAVVDYAHTPDALQQVLAALRPVATRRGGQLWCVFGCGGDRDPLKRPLMGAAAAAADHVVVTSDNPRSEDPLAIIGQIIPGLKNHPQVTRQVDRALAIGAALQQAAPADVVLVAGKGHETTQEIAGMRHVFSDQDQVRRALARWSVSRRRTHKRGFT